MAIFVTGDTHGAESYGCYSVDGYLHRFNTSNFPEQKTLNKNDYVIICGDFGGVWRTNRENTEETPDEKHNLDWLEKKPFTTLFVPGNHENYDRLTGIQDETLLNSWMFNRMSETEKNKFRKGYPQTTWNGGTVRQIRPSVLMLEPGIFDLNGMKCFAYGGAQSHDIRSGILNPADYQSYQEFNNIYRRWSESGYEFRVKGVSWWSQEMPAPETEDTAIKALQDAKWKVDFVFTHDCAASDHILLGYHDTTRINQFLNEIKAQTQYKHWFFGHLHDNRNLPGGKDHLIYEQIIRIA